VNAEPARLPEPDEDELRAAMVLAMMDEARERVAGQVEGRVFVEGYGPHFSSRALRRGHFRGVEGKHDASKRPTLGRVRRARGGGTPWTGANVTLSR
jgi:hypothetical protein